MRRGIMRIVLRSMRQHALSTAVTLLSVGLASGLVMAVFSIKEQTYQAFTGGPVGFDAVLGARGSQLQLVLNTVFHLETSPGNIPYSMYTAVSYTHLDVYKRQAFVIAEQWRRPRRGYPRAFHSRRSFASRSRSIFSPSIAAGGALLYQARVSAAVSRSGRKVSPLATARAALIRMMPRAAGGTTIGKFTFCC